MHPPSAFPPPANDLQQAEQRYRELIQVEPGNADAHFNLGIVLKDQGRYVEATQHFQQAVHLRPSFIEAYNNLAIVIALQGRLDDAAACLQQALGLKPDYAQAHVNLGKIYHQQGELDKAAACFEHARALKPDYAPAYYNLGVVRAEQGRADEAIDNYRQALCLWPDMAEAHNNLADLLRVQGQLEAALTTLQRALTLHPQFAEAHANAGFVLKDQGRLDAAATHFQEALHIRPSSKLQVVLATMLPPIYQSRADLQAWRERLTSNIRRLREERVLVDLTQETAPPLFYLPYQGLNDRDLQQEYSHLFVAPQLEARWQRSRPRTTGGKIKIGFLSAYFRNHTIGRLTGGLIANLSRDDFDVTVLTIGRHEDDIGRFIKEHADRYVEIPRNLPVASRLIAEQQLDVLFYPEIGMDSATYSLAFLRLAPVQCVTWGHPDTTGINALDYFISSKLLETEGADRHYTEQLVQLEHPCVFYHAPRLPMLRKGRAVFDLPEKGHLYGCLQSLFKFHPDFDDILGAILRADPQGHLVVIRGWSICWNEQLGQRWAHTLPDVSERICWLSALGYEDYLNVSAICDVLLDPLHFGGGNTSYEALALGVPVVTLPSEFLRGRITLGLYKQMQVLDCVADSPEAYVQLAVRLAREQDYRESIRSKILAANGALYENAKGMRELEEFLKNAVANSPTNVDVVS